jgi:amino acid adenylation domain-containing protein
MTGGKDFAGAPRAGDASNATATDFPDVCAHELIERQAAASPDAIALVHLGRTMTYGELNARANAIAHHLRKHGVGPDVLVAVCLQRCPDMVAALLGVWKAGGAYVPLDPSYPSDRLAFMIGDAETAVVLTHEPCRGLLAETSGTKIFLDTDWPRIATEPVAAPAPLAKPANLAYVMYTSGSTGKPKGAMIQHDGLVNYLWWAKQAYAVEPGRSAPVHSSMSFDLTVTSLYVPLVAGGSVELLPEDVGAESLIEALLASGNRSLIKITPAHLEILHSRIGRDKAAGMTRVFVIGGENLLADNLSLWRDLDPPTRLINEYGPTETVVGCSIHEIVESDPRTGSVPIGRPIANTQLYVLDESLAPVPVGATGELYIGGAGVARGYLKRPELTAERFLPDPFSARSGARLYKSGDLARYRADGVLEYLGRADDQVKVRGYRIELGEIEAALAAHPSVQTCSVVAREDEPGNKQLAAYFVARTGQTVTSDALRGFLGGRLPDYMVPTYFTVMPSLPLTPNGKVDRKMLPAPVLDASETAKGGIARTGTEQAVAGIWREVLKLDDIGIGADFFDIGGTSFAATALLAKVRAAFGVDLKLAQLFEEPTIAGVARAVDTLLVTRNGGGSSGSGPRDELVL